MLGNASTIQLLAWLAVAAVAVHAASTISLHWLVPGVNPLSEMVSAYLNTAYQWLSRLSFVALACALGLIATALALRHVQGVMFIIALILVAIAAIGLLVVAVAPGAARTVAGPTQPAAVLALLLLSLVLRHEPAWQSAGPVLLGLSLGLVTLFVVTIMLRVMPAAGLGGLANRAVLVLIYSWIVLVARGLMKP